MRRNTGLFNPLGFLPLLLVFRLCGGGEQAAPPPVLRSAPPAVVLDRDGDGVRDAQDACPEEAEDRDGHQDDDGCPDVDNDGDGFWDGPVADGGDVCPSQAGAPLYQGCPALDRDGDGVSDAFDPCPEQAGPLDLRGCAVAVPIALSPTRVRLLGAVQFSVDKATLRPESHAVLEALAGVLKAHPGLFVEIQNHRDAYPRQAYGMRLTDKRAQAVRAFLVHRGVSEERLVARGYGEEVPIDTNATAEGRARNRRTEVHILAHRRAGFAPVEVRGRADHALAAGPGDADGDGVLDRADACPRLVGALERRGCP